MISSLVYRGITLMPVDESFTDEEQKYISDLREKTGNLATDYVPPIVVRYPGIGLRQLLAELDKSHKVIPFEEDPSGLEILQAVADQRINLEKSQDGGVFFFPLVGDMEEKPIHCKTVDEYVSIRLKQYAKDKKSFDDVVTGLVSDYAVAVLDALAVAIDARNVLLEDGCFVETDEINFASRVLSLKE